MGFFKESDATYKNVGSLNVDKCNVQLSGDDRNLLSIPTANRLLKERGKVVYGQTIEAPSHYPEKQHTNWNQHKVAGDHYTALLICIEPIAKDTAEKIVAGFMSLIDEEGGMLGPRTSALYNRARKLLEGAKG